MKGNSAIKKQLLKMREELLEDLDESLKTSRSAPERDVGDFYDDVDFEKDRQMLHMLGERERAKLVAIDDALERIKEGSYGVCEECGEDINRKRLKVLPFARYCVRCQAEIEKHPPPSQEGLEENLIYKNVAYNDVESGEE